ncbi:Hypothetical predicted protein [Lynx pardinus]|uniref:Uncharacterized protein n=1 Tax=Lynx pardinus TaxID=191816 RepID=A0A485NHL2_LYNPA|nr:Hypothetical predicted protein [Lynx pardinus]
MRTVPLSTPRGRHPPPPPPRLHAAFPADYARPRAASSLPGPRNRAPAGAASRATDAGITWVRAFGLRPRVDLQAPQT